MKGGAWKGLLALQAALAVHSKMSAPDSGRWAGWNLGRAPTLVGGLIFQPYLLSLNIDP